MKPLVKYITILFLVSTTLTCVANTDDDFPYSVGTPKNWKEHSPEWATKVSNFRPPFLALDTGELIMFGVAAGKTAGVDLLEEALLDARSKTFERGGILFSEKKELLKSKNGLDVLKAEFATKNYVKMKFIRYYMMKDGALFWINTYAKTEESSEKLEQHILQNLTLDKG